MFSAMHPFLEDLKHQKVFVLRMVGLTIAALVMGIAFPFVFDLLASSFTALAPVFKVEGDQFEANVVLFPVAMLGITTICLILEAFLLGYERSTLRSVIVNETPSVRTDVFFLLFRISGLMVMFSLLFSFGGLYVVADYIQAKLDFAVMRNVDSVVLHFVSMAVLISFVNYWIHRLLHSPLFWEIHKVHHSAEDVNVLLPYRNHPVDFVIATFYGAAVVAILGVKPEAMVLWLGVNAVYQSMVHSQYDWKWRWLEYIVITPAAHRIHHSTAAEHYTKNLGILSIWDRLFGTYLPPTRGALLNYGVPDRQNFNTGRFFNEIMECFWRWIGVRRPVTDKTV
jgi:sterol desaturase/sphingolipid hydroxylase (fatty acid hydroxylase superfamily)